MATVVMMVGFIGMMEAVAISATTMDHARRQTFATQVMSHEIDRLYFLPWSGTTSISGLPTANTDVPFDPQFWPNWSATNTYAVKQAVNYSGAYYRCRVAHSNVTPPNASYWTATTAADFAAPMGTGSLVASDIIVVYSGATFTLARTVTNPDPVTNIRQINFTISWTVATGRIGSSVSQGSRTVATGADDYSTNQRRAATTHTRVMSAWYGKYGLPLSYQRS